MVSFALLQDLQANAPSLPRPEGPWAVLGSPVPAPPSPPCAQRVSVGRYEWPLTGLVGVSSLGGARCHAGQAALGVRLSDWGEQ